MVSCADFFEPLFGFIRKAYFETIEEINNV